MSLDSGKKLAHYEIIEPIGKGGMGEVYRARDTKLGRDVAIKVLPELFSQDAERLARFEREAKVLASLNHPNIAAIYGLELSESTHYLVLEMVEGETLAERIARGPIPMEEALVIASAIADALEDAHERGIVHRDLKPANVKITPDDKIKVLDFGLAKAFVEEAPAADSSMSPTITRDATRAGVILGTAAYMSPEQAKGKRVDKRTDIFALGAVLYEMLTGKKAFPGDDVSEVLGSVLKLEPDWSALPSGIPPRLLELLQRCLDKDAKKRRRDVGDVRNEMANLLADDDPVGHDGASSLDRRQTLFVGAAGVVAGVILTSLVTANLRSPPAARNVTRVGIAPSEPLDYAGRHNVALSPDGSRLVYATTSQLYLRNMDEPEDAPVRGSGSLARNPFFSPDGQWIGFWSSGKLMKISVDGGTPVKLCQASNPYGASWGPDGTIVYAQGTSGEILRVSEQGGTPDVIVAVDSESGEFVHGPQLLPSAKHLLFTLRTGASWDEAQIVVRSLETGEQHVLIDGGADARYVATGHLVYALDTTLFAVPFDTGRLEVTGGATPVVEDVMRSPSGTGAAQFSVSETGSLVFSSDAAQERLVSIDREGNVAPLRAPPRAYGAPRLSPDGTQLLFEDRGDMWVHNIGRGSVSRLTSTGDTNHHGWTSRGERVFFSSTRTGRERLFWAPADGTGEAEPIIDDFGFAQHAVSSSLDGQWLTFLVNHPDNASDIWVVPLQRDGGERQPRPVLGGPFTELSPEISPDTRWLAYSTDETGRQEVYIRPFPDPGPKVRVSTEGGNAPQWAASGRELFYRNGTTMMVVSIATEDGVDVGTPAPLFDSPLVAGPTYNVTNDGERFIMVEPDPAGSELRLVLNWFEELKELAPAE